LGNLAELAGSHAEKSDTTRTAKPTQGMKMVIPVAGEEGGTEAGTGARRVAVTPEWAMLGGQDLQKSATAR
jgi:hypothetical protein